MRNTETQETTDLSEAIEDLKTIVTILRGPNAQFFIKNKEAIEEMIKVIWGYAPMDVEGHSEPEEAAAFSKRTGEEFLEKNRDKNLLSFCEEVKRMLISASEWAEISGFSRETFKKFERVSMLLKKIYSKDKIDEETKSFYRATIFPKAMAEIFGDFLSEEESEEMERLLEKVFSITVAERMDLLLSMEWYPMPVAGSIDPILFKEKVFTYLKKVEGIFRELEDLMKNKFLHTQINARNNLSSYFPEEVLGEQTPIESQRGQAREHIKQIMEHKNSKDFIKRLLQ